MQYQGYVQPIYFFPAPMAPNEEFRLIDDKVIKNVIPRYLVSNYGRVYDIYLNTFPYMRYDRKGSKFDGTPKGYLYHEVSIRMEDGSIQRKRLRLSRTVAIMFNPVPGYQDLEVNHISGDHSDNRIWNLEWCTTAENKNHAYEERIYPIGENRFGTYITNKQAEEVCQYIAQGLSNPEIVAKTNVPLAIVGGIRKRHSFRYISYNYTFPDEEKLPENVVREICERLSRYENCETIYHAMRHYREEIGMAVKREIIQAIRARAMYKDISKDYEW
jgi:predicted DNA-binding protein YlxM (UPF0122 family)